MLTGIQKQQDEPMEFVLQKPPERKMKMDESSQILIGTIDEEFSDEPQSRQQEAKE